MPIVLQQQEDFLKHVGKITDVLIRDKRPAISHKEFCTTFVSNDTFSKIEDMVSQTNLHSMGIRSKQNMIVHVDNDLVKADFTLPVEFTCARWMPRDLSSPITSEGKFQELVAFAVQNAFDVGLFSMMTEKLVRAVPSWKAMRYMFPGTLTLLRSMTMVEGVPGNYYPDLADKIATIKSAPSNLPSISHDGKQKLRYLNTWMGVQVLTESFNRSIPLPDDLNPERGDGSKAVTCNIDMPQRRITSEGIDYLFHGV